MASHALKDFTHNGEAKNHTMQSRYALNGFKSSQNRVFKQIMVYSTTALIVIQ